MDKLITVSLDALIVVINLKPLILYDFIVHTCTTICIQENIQLHNKNVFQLNFKKIKHVLKKKKMNLEPLVFVDV